MCNTNQKTDSPDSSSSSSIEVELRIYYVLQFSGATISTSKGDSGASTSKGDAGASTSKGDSSASTSKRDSGASTSKGDAGASTSKGDSGASTSKGDSGASTSKGDSGASTSSENGFYGPAGAAAMLFAKGRDSREDSDRFAIPLYTFRQGLGSQTTSVAEYRGLILGLKETIRRGYTEITVQGSSELVVNQFLGNREINDPELRSLCDEALELRNSFESFSIIHIDQHLSCEVDYHATRAISLPDGQVEVAEDSFIDQLAACYQSAHISA